MNFKIVISLLPEILLAFLFAAGAYFSVVLTRLPGSSKIENYEGRKKKKKLKKGVLVLLWMAFFAGICFLRYYEK